MNLHAQQEERKQRIQEVYKFIEKNQPVSIEKIISWFAHISRRTISEYVKTLVYNGKVENTIHGFVIKKSS